MQKLIKRKLASKPTGLEQKKAASPTHVSASALVDNVLMKTPRKFSGALKDRKAQGFTCASRAAAWGPLRDPLRQLFNFALHRTHQALCADAKHDTLRQWVVGCWACCFCPLSLHGFNLDFTKNNANGFVFTWYWRSFIISLLQFEIGTPCWTVSASRP